MGHTDPLKQARATPREQQQQKPKASINKMQHIRRMQHLCGIYCESRERESRNRGRKQQHVAHLKRTKYLCCKLLHTLWHIGALCRAANGKWVTTVPEGVCEERQGRCSLYGYRMPKQSIVQTLAQLNCNLLKCMLHYFSTTHIV